MDTPNVFQGFKSGQPSFELFPEVTDHPFILESWGFGDSFHVPDGTPKTEAIQGWKLPPWEDATPEIWLRLESTKGLGSMFYHAHWLGYRSGESITAKEFEDGVTQECAYFDKDDKPLGAVYACAKNEDGELTRLVDDANTGKAQNIFNTILAGFGVKTGSSFEALNKVIKDESIIIASVTHSTFGKDKNGKPRRKAEMGTWKNPSKVEIPVEADDWKKGE